MVYIWKNQRTRKYVVDFRDKQGKRRRIMAFERKKDADKKAHEIEGELCEGTYIPPKEIPPFGQVAEDWLAGKKNYRPSTLAQWRAHLDRHLFPKLKDFRLDQIDIGVIEKVRDEWYERGKLSAQTINKVLTTAAAIFKYAIRRKLIRSNPAAEAERLRVSSGELTEASGDVARDEDILSPDETRRLIDHAAPGFHQTFISTAALTGARHDELLALQWGDMELQTGKLIIRRSLSWAKAPGDTEPKARFFEPKTRAGIRTLPMPFELVTALRAWKLQCPPSELDLVFPSPSGKPMHRSNVLRQGLYPALRRAGLRKVDMHSLRHSFASALINSGAPVTEVQYLLGHSSPQTTLRVYSHWFKKVETGSVNDLAKRLLGQPAETAVAPAKA